MATLYELSAEARALRDTMLDAGISEEAISDTLEAETGIVEKIQQYVYVIKEMESFANSADVEAKRMTLRAKTSKERVATLKNWLMQNMQHAGIKKQEYPEFTVRVQNNPQSVDILNESVIPKSFFVTPEVEPRLDRKLILEKLKDGEKVKGAAIKQTQTLRIV